MDYTQIIYLIAPSIAGTSLTSILATILFSSIKKAFKKKVNEVGEASEYAKLHKENEDLKSELQEIKETLNRMRGKV